MGLPFTCRAETPLSDQTVSQHRFGVRVFFPRAPATWWRIMSCLALVHYATMLSLDFDIALWWYLLPFTCRAETPLSYQTVSQHCFGVRVFFHVRLLLGGVS